MKKHWMKQKHGIIFIQGDVIMGGKTPLGVGLLLELNWSEGNGATGGPGS